MTILGQSAQLKKVKRHCVTEEGRSESVADHSWRMALMAMLICGEEEFKELESLNECLQIFLNTILT